MGSLTAALFVCALSSVLEYMEPELKLCCTCQTSKPLGDFHNSTKTKDGKQRACKLCGRASQIIWERTHPAEMKTRRRRIHLKREYGITQEDYLLLLTKQGGVCIICGEPPKPGMNLAVDHDHRTKRVRGLLCHDRCNRALGYFRDRVDLVKKAVEYLEANLDFPSTQPISSIEPLETVTCREAI